VFTPSGTLAVTTGAMTFPGLRDSVEFCTRQNLSLVRFDLVRDMAELPEHNHTAFKLSSDSIRLFEMEKSIFLSTQRPSNTEVNVDVV
jgi:hypothetical protein